MKRFLKLSPYLILLGGFALRLYRLGANSLWYDETVSLFLAQSDLAELIRHTAGDIHPPLYYLLLHFWGRVAGWSEFAAAFLSVWFGVLLIALVYRVTREWFASPPAPLLNLKNINSEEGSQGLPLASKLVSNFEARGLGGEAIAMVAAFFVALSPYNIWYSQEVRMYTLGAVLGLLSIYFLRRMIAQGKIFSRDFFAYLVVTVLGFYALYYFVFLMILQWAWLIHRVTVGSKNDARGALTGLAAFLFSQIALIVLYLPWLFIALRQAIDPPVPPWREFISLPRVMLETFSALAFGQAVDPNVFGVIALLLFIPISALLWRERNREIENRKLVVSAVEPSKIENSPSPFFLLGYFLIPLAAIFLFSLWKPLYHVRYMFTSSPAFYILAAYALVNLPQEFSRARTTMPTFVRQGLGALAILVSALFVLGVSYSLYNFWHNEQYAKDDLRGAVNFIAERWRPGDVILVNAGYAYPAFAYYYPDPIARRVRLPFYMPLAGGASALATASKRPTLLLTGSIGGAKNLGWRDARSDFFATTAEETRLALDGVLEAHQRVWMLRLYDTVVDPEGITRRYLEGRARLFENQGFTGESQLRVQGFITESNPSLPVTANFTLKMIGEQAQLAGYETGARNLRAGDVFDAVLYWRLIQSVNHNYRLSLQLLDSNDQNIAQTDELPLSEMLPMTRWNVGELYRQPLRVKIPQHLAAGEYRAIVKLYEPRSGEVLGKVIELGTIQVR